MTDITNNFFRYTKKHFARLEKKRPVLFSRNLIVNVSFELVCKSIGRTYARKRSVLKTPCTRTVHDDKSRRTSTDSDSSTIII